MKKLFLLLAVVGICVVATAQNKQKAQSIILHLLKLACSNFDVVKTQFFNIQLEKSAL